MRALLWSFGGAEQDEAGNVTINSKQTIEALKYMKELYQQTETPEVFTWTPPSNNQAMLAGRVSYVANAISITRQSEREKLPIDSKIMISPALKGPVRRIAAEHVMNCHVIWEFAENKEGAQQFLIDFMDHFHEGFAAGQFYNFPCFPKTVPDLQKEDRQRPAGESARQVQGAGQRPRLGHERRVSRATRPRASPKRSAPGSSPRCSPPSRAGIRPRKTPRRRRKPSTSASSPDGSSAGARWRSSRHET